MGFETLLAVLSTYDFQRGNERYVNECSARLAVQNERNRSRNMKEGGAVKPDCEKIRRTQGREYMEEWRDCEGFPP
jgi:hypothetical protein